MAAILNRYGRFDETMEWLGRARDIQTDNPEGYYLIATHYWDKVYRDPDLTMEQRQEFIDMGDNSVIVVKFNRGQIKSLMVKYARLLKV